MAINQNTTWNIIIGSILIFLFFVVPVGAYTGSFIETDSHSWTYTEPTGSSAGGDYSNSWLYIRDISHHTDGLQFVSETVPYSNFKGTKLATYESYFESITLTDKDTGTFVASGSMGYYNMSASSKVKIWLWVDVDTWNTSYVRTLSGAKYFVINGMTASYYDTDSFRNSANVVWSGDTWEVFFAGQAGPVINYDHGYYNVQSRVYFNNEYEYTSSGGIHIVEVSKTVDTYVSPSQVFVNNSDGDELASDADFNTVNFYMQDNNESIPYQLKVIAQSTGTVHTATLYPSPQDEDTIEWGVDSYVVDDTGSYSWSLSDDNWDTWLYSKKVSIYRDETMVHEVSLPNKTGTFYYTFEEKGSFTVKLRHTSALLPHVTIDSDTVSVTPIGESFIGVTNATIYINTPIEFQFSYGFTPLPVSPGVWSSATSIEARKLIDGDWITVNRWFYPELGNVTPNVLYTYTIGTTGAYSDSMLVSEGDYIFYLTDFNHGDVASTNVYTVEYQPGAPTENITTTYLNILSGESYKFDDLFTFKYGIDNTNFTSGVNYIEIYNYDHEVITQSVLLFKQSWYKDGYIFPPSDDDPTELFQYGGIVALPGNNTMRIRHDDINGSTELVHDNFTLSELTNRGFGLKLSKYEACINEPIIISVTIPSNANLTIFSPSGIEIITYNLNASTTITYYFPISGQYILKLIPSGETYEEARATIYISDCADDGIIEPPSGEMDDMYINLFNAMTIPAFWGMIIFIGFIGGLAIKRDKNGDALVSGNGLAFIAFGLLNLLSIIGLFAPYTFYIIVSTWIFAGMFFGVGRYLARGEG